MQNNLLPKLKLPTKSRRSGGGTKQELGLDPTLVGSSGGVFEVEYGGKLVFSKKELGRFPNAGEAST